MNHPQPPSPSPKNPPPKSPPRPRTTLAVSPRTLAAHAIERVIAHSAFAAAVLDATLEKHPQLDERERGLLTELVYTTLRYRRGLENALAALIPRGLPTDPVLLSHLLVAAAQILLFPHAFVPVAVDATVSMVRERRGDSVAGFANAVLRRLSTERSHFDAVAAARASCPAWLLERLIAAVGPQQTDALLGIEPDGSLTRVHTVALRTRTGRPLLPWLGEAEPGSISPLCRRIRGMGDPRRLPGWEEGEFVVQEEGAQLVALAVGARPGETILDACAGRGQKTSLLAELVAPGGTVLATDIHPKKLTALETELVRLGLGGVRCQAVDWSREPSIVDVNVDRALVDAPCTGTGTLRRRPEIAFRLSPEDPARLGHLAAGILRNVARSMRPLGTVVYAVCSVLVEEGEEVVSAVADCLSPVPFEEPAVVAALGQGVSAGRLLPGTHGTDGYFLARLRRPERV
jgi:16S rRNA (cytosine967-C5)-methyltransferase